MKDKFSPKILVFFTVIILSTILSGCQNKSTYIGDVQTYWVNSLNITDYYEDITCPVYRNESKHFYEIDYEGTRYELIREFPLDVNEDETLILQYRFKNFEHYIESIPK